MAIAVEYESYLRSPKWRRLRLVLLRLRGKKCESCEVGGALSIHHRTYERLGGEKAADLSVLCQDCHTGVHQLHRSGSFGSLAAATDAVIRSGPSIASLPTAPEFVPRNLREAVPTPDGKLMRSDTWRDEARGVAGLNNSWGDD